MLTIDMDTARRFRLLADGVVTEVKIEGWKQAHFALSSDVTLLHDLSAGRVPPAWTPSETSTTEGVVFLAAIDEPLLRCLG